MRYNKLHTVKFDDWLLENFPDIYEDLNSPESEKSVILIQERLAQGLEPEEVACFIGISAEEYLSYEFADREHSLSEYDYVINKLHEYKDSC